MISGRDFCSKNGARSRQVNSTSGGTKIMILLSSFSSDGFAAQGAMISNSGAKSVEANRNTKEWCTGNDGAHVPKLMGEKVVQSILFWCHRKTPILGSLD